MSEHKCHCGDDDCGCDHTHETMEDLFECLDAPLKFHLEEGAVFEDPRIGDAGFDLRALENSTINPHEQQLIRTGLRIAIPVGWVGIVKDRSSMAKNRIYSHAGVIDESYRGEVLVMLSNDGNEPYQIEKGAKIAQLLIIPCMTESIQVETIEELGKTERGEGGFGSTGK